MIYFVQCGKNGPVKIGCTGNVEDRITQMQTSCPYELKLLWKINGGKEDEAELHEQWKHERIRGEWFRPSRQLLEYIETEASNNWEIKLSTGQIIDIYETKITLRINLGGWWVEAERDNETLVIDAAPSYKIINRREQRLVDNG